MQVQIHTDNLIAASDAMARWATQTIETALKHVSARITRIEAHLSDEGRKTGADNLQCVLEARLEGHQPLVVKHHAAHMNQAIDGACERLLRLVDNTLDRTVRS